MLGSCGHLDQMFKTAVACLFYQIKIIPLNIYISIISWGGGGGADFCYFKNV